MINILTKSLDVVTLTQSGETFSIDFAVSFSVLNLGECDATISYSDGSAPMTIPQGQSRSFGGHSGFVYKGEMKVSFPQINIESGMADPPEAIIEIVKDVINTDELQK